MRLGKVCFYILLLSVFSISQSYAQDHSHGERYHTHALPVEGINHQHGKGAMGKSPISNNNGMPKSLKSLDHYKVKDGLAVDVNTGLMWMRCSVGFTWSSTRCEGKGLEVNWDQAMKIPLNFEYAGYSDWRLPTHKELLSLRDCNTGQVLTYSVGRSRCEGNFKSPTIAQSVFMDVATFEYPYNWSSSPDAGNSSNAWNVNFHYGGDFEFGKDKTHYVRLVRSGH